MISCCSSDLLLRDSSECSFSGISCSNALNEFFLYFFTFLYNGYSCSRIRLWPGISCSGNPTLWIVWVFSRDTVAVPMPDFSPIISITFPWVSHVSLKSWGSRNRVQFYNYKPLPLLLWLLFLPSGRWTSELWKIQFDARSLDGGSFYLSCSGSIFKAHSSVSPFDLIRPSQSSLTLLRLGCLVLFLSQFMINSPHCPPSPMAISREEQHPYQRPLLQWITLHSTNQWFRLHLQIPA